jgi:hypothetical protein
MTISPAAKRRKHERKKVQVAVKQQWVAAGRPGDFQKYLWARLLKALQRGPTQTPKVKGRRFVPRHGNFWDPITDEGRRLLAGDASGFKPP